MNPFEIGELSFSMSSSSGNSGGNISGGDKINFGASSGSSQQTDRNKTQAGGAMRPENVSSFAERGAQAVSNGSGLSTTAVYLLAGSALVVGAIIAIRS